MNNKITLTKAYPSSTNIIKRRFSSFELKQREPKEDRAVYRSDLEMRSSF